MLAEISALDIKPLDEVQNQLKYEGDLGLVIVQQHVQLSIQPRYEAVGRRRIATKPCWADITIANRLASWGCDFLHPHIQGVDSPTVGRRRFLSAAGPVDRGCGSCRTAQPGSCFQTPACPLVHHRRPVSETRFWGRFCWDIIAIIVVKCPNVMDNTLK
jgi:hypothetical protein